MYKASHSIKQNVSVIIISQCRSLRFFFLTLKTSYFIETLNLKKYLSSTLLT